ncbi:hypothetical protein CHS0354_004115 [Potamilus streckersoni]|uniref:Uncharacterized protein n=1 Tax=Potamilus streckersoni TaxID=2493646 RepID=A0AAE0VWU7_9BIVA|nr:hypothetical protein CHS0354_004115 [Potamilus streckersoni]
MMTLNSLWIAFLCGFLQSLCVNTNLPTKSAKMKELYAALLQNSSLDIRPGLNSPRPLTVDVSFSLGSFNDFDEVKEELSINGYVTVTWTDDRVFWNPYQYVEITSVIVPWGSIWSPPLVLLNPSNKISDMNRELTTMRLLYNGTAIWTPGDVFEVKCYADVEKYPFDEQTCSIGLAAWGYLSDEVWLSVSSKFIDTAFYKDSGEWRLKHSDMNTYVKNSLSVASIRFTFKRRSSFAFVNLIMPIIIFSILNIFVFSIPPECGERISYATTVLLSFVVFMTVVSDNIPRTSAPVPLLCYYLISIVIESALITICMIVIMHLHSLSPKDPIPNCLQSCPVFLTRKRNNLMNVIPAFQRASSGVKLVDVTETTIQLKNQKHSKDTDFGSYAPTWFDIARKLDKIMSYIFVTLLVITNIGYLVAMTKS